jgi:hypothetical protein
VLLLSSKILSTTFKRYKYTEGIFKLLYKISRSIFEGIKEFMALPSGGNNKQK